MDTHTLPMEGIALIKDLLKIHTPIVLDASCMDHGQGAEMLLGSSEHEKALAASQFDLGFWFYEQYHELCESTGCYWGGGGDFSIDEHDGKICVQYSITKGSFSGCTSPIEDRFFANISELLSDKIEKVRPDLPIDESMIYIDFDFKFTSGSGVEENTAQIRVSTFEDDEQALSDSESAELAQLVCKACEDAAQSFESEIGADPSLWINVSSKDAFIEQFEFDSDLYYGIDGTFELVGTGR